MTYTLYRNFLGRWFGKVTSIVISETELTMIGLNKDAKKIPVEQLIDFPTIESSFLGNNLIIKTRDEVNRIWGVSAQSSKVFDNDIKTKLYKRICTNVAKQADLYHKEAIAQYLRDSSIEKLDYLITPLIQTYRSSKTHWQNILEKKLLSKIDVIARMPPINDGASYRQYYENKVLKAQDKFFNNIESNPLTKEQRLAVIRNNDKNLILAAAGTGKTSVMVAKALSLITFDKVPANNVLVLAYNNAAAKELTERLAARQKAFGLTCKPPTILTFHALGLQILNKANANTSLSSFAGDDKQVENWFSQWLVAHICQSTSAMKRFIDLAYQSSDAVEFNSHQEHEAHVKELMSQSLESILAAITSSGLLAENIKKYIKCLQAIRVEQLSVEQIEDRLQTGKVNSSKQYAALLNDIAQAYAGELKRQEKIDFDDMIINAFEHVSQGSYLPQWTDILVDEFQDISSARMNLLNALINRGPKPRLTVVGDDWQSIYRFSGAKLELITQFEKLSGSHSLTSLQKTFRYNNSIAETAGKFVMQNPAQYVKRIESHIQLEKSQVYIVDSDKGSMDEGVAQLVKNIRSKDATGSVAILARYRYLLNNAKEELTNLSDKCNINYWTFHSSKGLEADYSIILGFAKGKTGFPSENNEEALIEALLPVVDGFKYSEERRLFYVALTRAKKKAYLIADPVRLSAFIEELLSPEYDVNIESHKFEKSAKEADKRCGKCGRLMKLRKGQYGDFWGCSGFASIKDKCSYTEKVDVAVEFENAT